MDPDAPPLVKADTLASQGEQLSSRRAYQQAHRAHSEAAEQYQLAAQATGDTMAAKALLLQRDRQLKCAKEVLQKLERGRSKPVVSSSTATTTTSTTAQGPLSAMTAGLSIANSPGRAYGTLNSHPHQPQASSSHGMPYRQPIVGLQQYNHPAGRLPAGGTNYTPFIPRERIDASTNNMTDSRYSRKSNSPSQSQISSGLPHSAGESAKASSVEESYYLMNTENDPADPVTTFLTVVENMVEELGNAVAFASAPLHISPPLLKQSALKGLSHIRQASDGSTNAEYQTNTIQSNQVLESFYVVPSVNRPGKQPRESINNNTTNQGSDRPNSAQNKTHEELVTENMTLKETLDQLSKRLEWIKQERIKEKESLKDSVSIFARDVKKQAERLGQSTVNFAPIDTHNKRQMPIQLSNALPAAFLQQHGTASTSNSPQTEELYKKIQVLQDELKTTKLEAEKQSANAQRYKARYDDLRKAILEKRKAKEMAIAAAAGDTPGGEEGSVGTAK